MRAARERAYHRPMLHPLRRGAAALGMAAVCVACGKGGTANSTGGGGAGDGGGGGAPPQAIEALSDVAVGETHSCVIAQPGGRVICWGSNAYGEVTSLRDAHRRASHRSRRHRGRSFRSALGTSDTCIRREDGSVRCWGRHELTEGASQLADIVDVAVGTAQACAIVADGSVYCWMQSPGDPHQSTAPEKIVGSAVRHSWRSATRTPVPCSTAARCGAGGRTPRGSWAIPPPWAPLPSRWWAWTTQRRSPPPSVPDRSAPAWCGPPVRCRAGATFPTWPARSSWDPRTLRSRRRRSAW